MADLKEKVVIITGASGGIGGATAVEFSSVGSRLCLTGRNEENLNETKQRCIEAGLSEANVLTVIADVTKQEDIKKIVDETIDKFKQIDVLVNNAGLVTQAGFLNTTTETFEYMFELIAKSVFCMSKAVVPHLLHTKGTVVNVSSITGTRPLSDMFAYSSAKASVNHMTQMMALELGPKGVRVNSVNPGIIMTDIFIKPGGHMFHASEKINEFYEKLAATNPLLRVGRPEEVAKTILFLASEGASFISGSIIPIDGARHATCTLST